jgi:hypothetical protein
MPLLKRTWVIPLIGWICLAASLTWAEERVNREIRPISNMSGTIISPLETGKQILSMGDKIVVGLAGKIEVKPGDHLEIFQSLSREPDESLDSSLRRIGMAVFLEKIDERRILCIIDYSVKEVSVGDWVFLVPSR